MKIFPFLKKSLISICMLASFLCVDVRSLSSSSVAPQQSGPSAGVRVEDAEQRLGPFAIGGQDYTVVLHGKRLTDASGGPPSQTLADIEISDSSGSVAYRKTFLYVIEPNHFPRTLSASAVTVSGKTGTGLVIHYVEQGAVSQNRESWQLFGLVNGKLAPLGKPTILGEGAAGGPYMGVIMRASNGSMSIISQPDTFDLRAWTGYFYVFIPLRVDWNHGGLTQGQRCMGMIGGGLHEIGCDMRAEAVRKPPTEEFTFTRLFVEPDENMGNPEHVVMQKDSKIEILGSRAITTWNLDGELIMPNLTDIWLNVRIDSRAGWIHGEEDFTAVGLSAGSPAQ